MSGRTRSEELLERHADRLRRSAQVRFIVEVSDGTVRPETFARYLMIEEAFVLTAARVAGFLAYSHLGWDEVARHAQALHSLVTTQRAYFAGLRGRWPLNEQSDDVLSSAAVLDRFVLERVAIDGAPGAIVVMFAAESLYAHWCAAAAATRQRRHKDVRAWIELHTEDTFTAQVRAFAKEVDDLDPQEVPDTSLDAWFTDMLDAEDAFHGSVYR
jgi:thiaminase/transcriptional activator TenA